MAGSGDGDVRGDMHTPQAGRERILPLKNLNNEHATTGLTEACERGREIQERFEVLVEIPPDFAINKYHDLHAGTVRASLDAPRRLPASLVTNPLTIITAIRPYVGKKAVHRDESWCRC